MKTATCKDLAENPKRYAKIFVRHHDLNVEEVTALIAKRPRGWVDEINRLIKLEKAEKKRSAKWQPTTKALEVLEEIQESKIHGVWFYRRYRQTIDAMKKHGLITFKIEQKYGDEVIVLHRVDAD